MFPKIALVKQAIENLYDATATIRTYQTATTKGIRRQALTELAKEVRCRIGYQSLPEATSKDTADTQVTIIKMFYDGEAVAIPAGAVIDVVWDDGRADTFENASVPAVYSHHAEVILKRVRDKP